MEQVQSAVLEAVAEAAKATEDFLAKHGDRDACGFAWVTVYEKGSTKMGRALIAAGFSKAYSGGLQMWNPSGNWTQCITMFTEELPWLRDDLDWVMGRGIRAWLNWR